MLVTSLLYLFGLKSQEETVTKDGTQGIEKRKLINTKEAAEMLGIGKRTLTTLASRGCISGAVRVGKQWRFNLEKLNAFIAGE